MSKRKPWKDSE